VLSEERSLEKSPADKAKGVAHQGKGEKQVTLEGAIQPSRQEEVVVGALEKNG